MGAGQQPNLAYSWDPAQTGSQQHAAADGQYATGNGQQHEGDDTDLMSLMSSLFGHESSIYGVVQPAHTGMSLGLHPYNLQNYQDKTPGIYGNGFDMGPAPYGSHTGPSRGILSTSQTQDQQDFQHDFLQHPAHYTPIASTSTLPMSTFSHGRTLPSVPITTADLDNSLFGNADLYSPISANGTKRRRKSSAEPGEGKDATNVDGDDKSGPAARAPKACGECRKAKVRCIMNEAGTLPCSRCKSTGKECHFLNTIGRGKVPRRNKSIAAQDQVAPATASPAEVEFAPPAIKDGRSLVSPQILPRPTLRPSPDGGDTSTALPSTTSPLQASASPRDLLLTSGSILSESDAKMLFDLFFSTLNVRWALLKKEVHSVDFCLEKSTFLYNTICFIASCYSISHTNLRKQLSDTVRAQALSVPIVSVPSLESVQAFLLLSLWGTGYGRRDEYDRAWTMICMACRMALDLQLFHASWKGTPGHIAERAWILCCVIDQTKSAQRGRIPTISQHSEAAIKDAQDWVPDEPECLLLAFYAELLLSTHKALNTLTKTAKDSEEFRIIVQTFESQASTWLTRFEDLRAKLQEQGRLQQTVDLYLAYLAEFYVSYWSLAVSSFAFQHALNSRNSVDTSFYFTTTKIYATRILKATEIELKRDSPLRVAPDGHFEFILHAAVFLLKISRYSTDGQPESHALIERVASLVSAVSRNQRDTPALYSALLWELSQAVKGQGTESREESVYSPVISSQTKDFARLLLQSSMWETVVFPGLNGANVESLDTRQGRTGSS